MPSTYDRTDLSPAALKAWQNAHPELMPADTPRRTPRLNHDYDTPKELPPMTTPSTPSPAEQFRADMMSLLDQMRAEIEEMHAEITQIRDGLTHAASQPATSGQMQTITATSLIMTYDDAGKPAYKVLGPPFAKFGVRVWPEVLPALGIDPTTLKPGPNAFNASVRVEMKDDTAEDGTVKSIPRKVIGLA